MGNLTFPKTSSNHGAGHVLRDSGRGVPFGVDTHSYMFSVKGRYNCICSFLIRMTKY